MPCSGLARFIQKACETNVNLTFSIFFRLALVPCVFVQEAGTKSSNHPPIILLALQAYLSNTEQCSGPTLRGCSFGRYSGDTLEDFPKSRNLRKRLPDELRTCPDTVGRLSSRKNPAVTTREPQIDHNWAKRTPPNEENPSERRPDFDRPSFP